MREDKDYLEGFEAGDYGWEVVKAEDKHDVKKRRMRKLTLEVDTNIGKRKAWVFVWPKNPSGEFDHAWQAYRWEEYMALLASAGRAGEQLTASQCVGLSGEGFFDRDVSSPNFIRCETYAEPVTLRGAAADQENEEIPF